MNKRILVALMAVAGLTIAGCSSTTTSGPNQDAVSQQRIATSEFRKEGIKISYNLRGQIDSIETTGYAAAWGNSANATREAYRVAELEAKKHLNDFINKETITSSVSVRMISQNLEHARDTTMNRTGSGSTAKPAASADELLAVDDAVAPESNTAEAVKNREDAMKIASTVSTTIRVNNRGILSGLRQVDARVVDDGRAVKVTYRWDRKHDAGRVQLRNTMAM